MEITPELIQAVLYIVIIISIVVFLVKKQVMVISDVLECVIKL